MLQDHLVYSLPVLKSAISLRSPSFFYWRMILKLWNLGTRCVHWCRDIIYFGPSQLTEQVNICVYTNPYQQIFCMHPSVSVWGLTWVLTDVASANPRPHEPFQPSPLVVTSHSNKGNLGSYQLSPFTELCNSKIHDGWLQNHQLLSHEKHLYQWEYSVMDDSFCFWSYNFRLFPILLGSARFMPTPSVRWFLTFVIQLQFFRSDAAFPPRIPQPLE